MASLVASRLMQEADGGVGEGGGFGGGTWGGSGDDDDDDGGGAVTGAVTAATSSGDSDTVEQSCLAAWSAALRAGRRVGLGGWWAGV